MMQAAANPESSSRLSPFPVRDALLVLAGIVITSAGHYLTPPGLLLWHGIFQRLYYLPVVYAAIAFGWRGGLAAAVLAGLAYIPHIATTWAHMQHYAYEQYAEIVMFLAVGVLTGILSDRERARRRELARANEELQSSFEQVRRADRLSAIGQLSAGLAHEIRNPLASIDGAAEVMEAGAEGEVRHEALGIIRKECARLNRLLTGLLDFARPRQPELREVDVARVLNSVLELVRHSAGKSTNFRGEIAGGLPPLRCDEEQLAQVVLNLALNAAQASPPGGEVTVGARARDAGVLIQVTDQGTGIPPEHLDRIFDPFFTTKSQGTGLGLAVVHQIVTQHGGTVTAERNAERGMTFTVYLPREAA
jgi:two-component system, NtrC family, sensor histidine kinase HydH